MRVIFAGTPEFAATALAALIREGYSIPLVLTQPDRPAGRGMKLTESPVKRLALAHGLPVLQPPTLRDEKVQAQLRAAESDVMVVVAYGLILPRAVLNIPRHGCFNIHASLLPRWRGAAPIQRALLAGDRETGITIIKMDEGLDTGPMLLKERFPIADEDTAQSLHDKLAALGAHAIVTALRRLEQGSLEGEPQDPAQATYAAKLSKTEGRLDWHLSAAELDRMVRAYNPFPVAHASFHGETWRIWRARPEPAAGGIPGEVLRADKNGIVVACGDGALRITEIQKAGGKRLPAAVFLQGSQVRTGERLDT
jgi:methionyl-tRNA formyltransferase